MKKLLSLALLLSVIGFFSSCNKEEKIVEKKVIVKDSTIVKVSANITKDTKWEAAKTYILAKRISVVKGATLTIEAGTVIKGEAGTGANATALIVARGAKIMAKGTATKPIIFTSVADKIKSGEIKSPNMSEEINGTWGGLIVLGSAKISVKSNAKEAQIEGIPADDKNGLYGGDNDADNSGVIEYVSVRHGGANIGEGNEINGITLGGVGSGTTISHVEVVANQDDGIEFFGGAVTVKNAIVWKAGDDAIDTDQAFSGKVDNFMVINPGDKCFELDGPEGKYAGKGHTIMNGTVKVEKAKGLIDYDDNSDVNMEGIYFYDIKGLKGGFQKVEGYKGYKAANKFSTKSIESTLPYQLDKKGKNPTVGTLKDSYVDGFDALVTKVTAGSQTKGAKTSEFKGWTMADKSGKVK